MASRMTARTLAKRNLAINGKEIGAFSVTLTAYRCRCGYEWLPKGQLNGKVERPKMCPDCRSYDWDKPFKQRAAVRKRRAAA